MKIIKGRLSKITDTFSQSLASNKSPPTILMIVPEVKYLKPKIEVYSKPKAYKDKKKKKKSSHTVIVIEQKEVDLKVYNPPLHSTAFDVESYVPLKETVPLSPDKLRFRDAAKKWRNEVRNISKLRNSRQKRNSFVLHNEPKIKQHNSCHSTKDSTQVKKLKPLAVKHYVSLQPEERFTEYDMPVRLGDYPLYLTNFPLAPNFPKPDMYINAHYIYVLVDPSDNTVRYIGSTTDPIAEYSKLKDCQIYNKKLYKWQKAINFQFKFEVVAKVVEQEAEQATRSWIHYYRCIGKIYNHKKFG